MRYFIFSKFISLIFFSLIFLFTGCSQKQPSKEPRSVTIEENVRKGIVSNALKYLNTKEGRDCSGFVALVNSENSEPYYKMNELSKYYTNDYRSKAMYNVMNKNERIIKIKTPKIADLVFFSDTLEKTKRKAGSLNITHVGIVTQIDKDGTVHFIHHIGGKNVMGAVNEKHPKVAMLKNKSVNSYLKRCEPKKPKPECLSAFFLTGYGEIEKKYQAMRK